MRDYVTNPVRWLGIKEVAKILGCDVQRVYQLVYERRIPYTRRGPGPRAHYLFDPAEVNAFIESFRGGPQVSRVAKP